MLPWTEWRTISKSFLRCFLFVSLFALKRSLVKKAILSNISFLTTCFFFCFYWENVAKKKKRSKHLPVKEKKRVKVFFSWSKAVLGQKKAKTYWLFLFLSVGTLVSFLLPLFSLTPNLTMFLFIAIPKSFSHSKKRGYIGIHR